MMSMINKFQMKVIMDRILRITRIAVMTVVTAISSQPDGGELKTNCFNMTSVQHVKTRWIQ